MMSSPTLAQLVRKWHRTYSSKNRWEFFYGYDRKTGEQDLKSGYLKCWKDGNIVLIKESYACIGQDTPSGNTESAYSGVKIIAADPRFFAKLDRMMQFATNMHKRRVEHEQSFMKTEMDLLKEVLG